MSEPVHQLTLAGIAAEQSAAPVSDAERQKDYTAEGFKLARPRDYALAARAFFELRLSKRGICELLGLSFHTLEALIAREASTRGTAELESRRRARIFMTEDRALDALSELLENHAAREAAGIVGLAKAVQLLQQARGDAPNAVAAASAPPPAPSIAPDDYIEVTDQPNESKPDKKSARPISTPPPPSTSGAQPDDKPRPGHVLTPGHSVEMSDNLRDGADSAHTLTTSRATDRHGGGADGRMAAARTAAKAPPLDGTPGAGGAGAARATPHRQ